MQWRKVKRIASERLQEIQAADHAKDLECLKQDTTAFLAKKGVELIAPQREAWQSIGPRSTTSLLWGRGVGKSFFLRLVAYMMLAQFDGLERSGARHKGIRIVWLMDTLKHFRDVHESLLLSELAGSWRFLGAKVNRTTWKVTFPGGSWMQPFPALEHVSQSSRGLRCDVVLGDEGDDIPLSVYQAVSIPWFTEPWSLKTRVMGGTPRKGRYGLLYHLFQRGKSDEPQDSRHHSFHATYRDAPEIVDPDEVEQAKAGTPPAIFSREWECSFDSPEGLVFDVWDEDYHVRRCPTKLFSKIAIGVDWGYVDPGVYLVIGITGHGEDSQAWVIDEVYKTGKVGSWWDGKAIELMREYPGAKWYADPSEPASIQSLRNSVGMNIQKADNAIAPGIRTVASLMCTYGEGEDRWGRLFVDPSCCNLIRELSLYRRKRDPRDRDSYLEEIEDKHNHAIDALRYAIVGCFGRFSATRHER